MSNLPTTDHNPTQTRSLPNPGSSGTQSYATALSSHVDTSSRWDFLSSAEQEAETKEGLLLPQVKFVDFEIDDKKYRIVTRKDFSEREMRMKALYPPSMVKDQMMKDEELGGYFGRVIKSLEVRKSPKDILNLMEIFTRTLNNVDQVREFSHTYTDTTLVAKQYELLNLPRFVNDWKVSILHSVSMRDGRIELHVNDISAAVQAVVNTANKECQTSTEEAARCYKEAITEAERLKASKLTDLGSLILLGTLMGGIKDQSDSVKSEAVAAYKAAEVDPESIPFDQWAAEWWSTVRYERVVLALEGMVSSESFSTFFRDRLFRA